MELRGKSALVTGGGRGIGAAVARRLAEAGAAVAVTARSTDEIGAVAEELRASGAEAHAITADVTDESAVAELAARAEEALGGIDILINNAGSATSAPLGRTTLETWERMLSVNATSTFLVTRAVVPGMVERGWGRVVNVASIAGKAGAPYIAAYVAAKHAVVGFTRAVAAELAKTGVTVNAVCPGYVDTPMTEASIARIRERTGRDAADALAILERQSPQGRIYLPEEVAYLVLTLCADLAGGVNGQALVLDGGSVQS